MPDVSAGMNELRDDQSLIMTNVVGDEQEDFDGKSTNVGFKPS